MSKLSEDAPSFSIQLNGIEAADYFTSLESRRYITRNQLGSFEIKLDDYQFETWPGLAKYQPAIIMINGTRIFKGSIDTIIRHYDKDADGYLITVTGRDDGRAIYDMLISKYYYLTTPSSIFKDLINNVYPSRKGTLDPAITLGEIDFHDHSYDLFTHQWYQRKLSDCINDLCADMEQNYIASSLFLDWWLDENDEINVTQTGELPLTLNPPVGSYGGDYIKTSDWTLDALPLQNDVWFAGALASGLLPLQIDYNWATAHAITASDVWTEGTSSYFNNSKWSNGAISASMTVTDNPTYHLSPGNQSIDIHFSCLLLPTTTVELGLPNYGPQFGTPFDVLTNTSGIIPGYFGVKTFFPWGGTSGTLANATKIFGRGPNGHWNYYNNDVMDETMGPISAIQFWMVCAQDLDVVVVLYDAVCPQKSVPSAIISNTVHYSRATNAATFIAGFAKPAAWKPMVFQFGPSGGYANSISSNYGASANFNWFDIAEMDILFIPSGLVDFLSLFSAGWVDVYLDELSFVKPLIAQGTPIPTDSIRSVPITDTTVNTYTLALARANRELALLNEPYSYVDYRIFGRPDLQVAHTFVADGNTMLIRESLTKATKIEENVGYEVQVKAWRPIGS
jgi:hypothetical protein